MRHDGTAHEEYAADVDVEDSLPFIEPYLGERLHLQGREHRGVVDHDVNAAEMRRNRLDHPHCVGLGGDVTGEAEAAVVCAGRLLGSHDVEDRDPCTFREESIGDRATDTALAASHDR